MLFPTVYTISENVVIASVFVNSGLNKLYMILILILHPSRLIDALL